MKEKTKYEKEKLPNWAGGASEWRGEYWTNYHQNCYMEEHRYCTDQCYQILDPWHNYIETHIHRIPFDDENHKC